MTRHPRRGRPSLVTAAGLVVAFTALADLLRRQPGPLPPDAPLERTIQRAVLGRPALKRSLDAVSALTWPRPAAAGVAVAALVLVSLRRRVEAIMLVALAWCANDSGYRVSKLVRRPRPEGHGVVVERRITGTFGFPSGHVVHSTAVFGFLLFLTGRHRRSVPAPAVWLARLLLLPVLLTIDTSRIVSGEHWPSDVLGGRLLGGAWLALFVHLHRRFTGGRAER